MSRKKILILLYLLCMTFFSYGSNLKTNEFNHKKFFSPTLNKKWAYSIYLPSSYNTTSDKKYPVIYLLHGMYNTNRTIAKEKVSNVFNTAIDNGDLGEVIVVCPSGNGDSWWIDSKRFGKIGTALTTDLFSHIESTYRTLNTRENRVIMGTSMGGFGSLNSSLKNPHLYKSVILLSPALYYPDPFHEPKNPHSHSTNFHYLMVRQNMIDRGAFGLIFDEKILASESYPTLFNAYNATQNHTLKFILYYGVDDGVTDNPTQNFIDFTKENNIEVDIVPLEGEHSWKVWKEALQHLFKNNKTFVEYK